MLATLTNPSIRAINYRITDLKFSLSKNMSVAERSHALTQLKHLEMQRYRCIIQEPLE